MAPKQESEPTNGWNQWQNLVLAELKRLHGWCAALDGKLTDGQDRLGKQITCLRVEIASLKTELHIKSGVWGALGGLIPAIATILIVLLVVYTKGLKP